MGLIGELTRMTIDISGEDIGECDECGAGFQGGEGEVYCSTCYDAVKGELKEVQAKLEAVAAVFGMKATDEESDLVITLRAKMGDNADGNNNEFKDKVMAILGVGDGDSEDSILNLISADRERAGGLGKIEEALKGLISVVKVLFPSAF